MTAQKEDARARWLRNTLIADNRDLLEREPELTTGKFAKMSLHPYNYFRGTAAIYYRDMLLPGSWNTPSKYTTAENAHALIVGDPHPENYGSYLNSDNRMVVDLNDFDSAMFGPYYLDVRRLGLGFYVFGQMAIDSKVMTPEDRQAMINAVISGYVEQMNALSSKSPGLTQDFARGKGKAGAGTILGDLIRRAERDGDAKEALDEYTKTSKNGRRRIKIGVVEDSEDRRIFRDKIVPPNATYQQSIKSTHQAYTKTLINTGIPGAPQTTSDFKGIGRRLGAGVSSYPVQRLYVLIEGPTQDSDDDLLLEYKEILDVPQLPGLTQFRNKRTRSNAERVVLHQRELQHSAKNDPWLGWVDLKPISFRVRTRTKYQKGVGIDRILEKMQEGDWSKQDVFDYAKKTGQLLALAHARAKNINGKTGLSIIHPAIEANKDGFIKETINAVNLYGPATLDDFQRFTDMLKKHGMSLGYRPTTATP